MKNIYQKIKNIVVKINYDNQLCGTGFIISKEGHILTCGHLFYQNGQELDTELFNIEGNKFTKTAEAYDKENNIDYAILKCEAYKNKELFPINCNYIQKKTENIEIKFFCY